VGGGDLSPPPSYPRVVAGIHLNSVKMDSRLRGNDHFFSVIPAGCGGYPSEFGQDGFPIENVGNDEEAR
ncbi:MAG: hypothetical protein OEY91_05650, partial [Nitrospirota bacterium]|nr:hypothetical protein [Nitrospirota bacterium]